MDIDVIEKAIKVSLEETLKRTRRAEELKKAQQGGRAIAEDAGYAADQRVVGALGQLDETADELEQAMMAAEQELPEGVALLADYQRRKAS